MEEPFRGKKKTLAQARHAIEGIVQLVPNSLDLQLVGELVTGG